MRYTEDPLFADEKRKHPALTLALLLIITVLALTLVLNHINNSRVDLLKETVTVDYLPSSLEGYRILHISDLHGLWFGAGQSRLRDTLLNARYDAVCITGDMTDKNGNADAFLAVLDLFDESTPVFFVPGDEDPAPITAKPHARAMTTQPAPLALDLFKEQAAQTPSPKSTRTRVPMNSKRYTGFILTLLRFLKWHRPNPP